MTSPSDKKDRERDIPAPRDVIDGIPDRTSRGRMWKLLVLAAIFAAWMAFLVFAQWAGRLR